MKKSLRLYRILSFITVVVLLLSVLIPVLMWKQIPDRIPVHYNIAGAADGWGSKGSLILVVFIECFVVAGMFFTGYIIKVSGMSAHATETDKENLDRAYPMIGWMNLIITGMFAYITFCSATERNLGKAFLPAVLVSVCLPMLYLIPKRGEVQADKSEKKIDEEEKNKKERMLQAEKKGEGKCYRTRVDWWLALMLIGAAAIPVVLTIREYTASGQIEWGMMILVWILVPLFAMLYGIRYILYPEHMKVCCGIFGTVRIPYSAVTSIKKTMNPLSSAAMSLRRIQIDYRKNGKNEMLLVSPKDRDAFIRELEMRISDAGQKVG